MTTWRLIKFIVKNETTLFLTITFILLISGLVETLGLLFIAPIVDIITSAGVAESSRITNGMIQFIDLLGFPSELWFLFLIYIFISIISGVLATLSLFMVQKIKYSSLFLIFVYYFLFLILILIFHLINQIFYF